MKKTLFFIFIPLFSSLTTHAQSWQYVGDPCFSSDVVNYPSIAIDSSGTPYMVYLDENSSSDYPGYVTVMKYNGSAWVNVGSPRFSAGVAYSTSIAIDRYGTPYVVYEDGGNSFKATVMKYNGSSWVAVGSPGFSAGQAESPTIAIDSSGTPYVAYADYSSDDDTQGNATVMKYNGTAWVNVGSPAFSAGEAYVPSIAIDRSGTPYVVYGDTGYYQATVMKYNGSSWVYVGSPDFSAASIYVISIAIDSSGTPYVAYEIMDTSEGSFYPVVMQYNGSDWVNVGSPGFGNGSAIISIAIWESTPYIVYQDWSTPATFLRASVIKYNDTGWTTVGIPGFSDSANFISIAINKYGVPYVAYQDYSTGKATVMAFGANNSIKSISQSALALSISPNPNNGSFTLNISSPQNQDATITITNILGQQVKQLTTTTNTDTQIQLNAPAGMYFISAVTQTTNTCTKMILQ